jgi:hypothetical protein
MGLALDVVREGAKTTILRVRIVQLTDSTETAEI